MAELKESFEKRFLNVQQGLLSLELAKDKNVKAGARSFKYLPLNKIIGALTPLMKENELIYSFTTETEGGIVNLVLKIIDSNSDKKIEGAIPLINSTTQHDPAQAQGSGLTYARRYLLEMVFGLVGDVSLDPDENFDKVIPQKTTQPPEQTPPKKEETFAPLEENKKDIAVGDIDLTFDF